MAGYFCVTGNPYVDAGVYAMMVFSDRNNPEEITIDDVRKMIKKIESVFFSENWKKSLHSIFPNSSITHNRAGSPESFQKMMKSLIMEMAPLEKGHCVACGKRETTEQSIYKDKVPLIGSGELLNFFPGANSGIDLCAGCVLDIQFMPLMIQKCGNKYALLHSGSEAFMRSWTKEMIRNVNSQLTTGVYDGPFAWPHGNPKSALMEATMDITANIIDELDDPHISVDLYHFTNYNQGPDLALYRLPSKIFVFIVKLMRAGLLREWQERIVPRGYYYNKKGKADIRTNRVYDALLMDRSILFYFINTEDKISVSSWELLEIYLLEVREMDKQRIQDIKRIGDGLACIIKESNRTKRLSDLERCRNYNEILAVLLHFTRDRIKQGKSPMNYEDVTEKLFPEGHLSFKETKYLLLFRIYEQLGDWLSNVESRLEEIEIEEEE